MTKTNRSSAVWRILRHLRGRFGLVNRGEDSSIRPHGSAGLYGSFVSKIRRRQANTVEKHFAETAESVGSLRHFIVRFALQRPKLGRASFERVKTAGKRPNLLGSLRHIAVVHISFISTYTKPFFYIYFFYINFLKGENRKAVVELSKLIHKYPDQASVWYQLAILLLRLKDVSKYKVAAKCAQATMNLGRNTTDVTKVKTSLAFINCNCNCNSNSCRYCVWCR